MQITVNGRIAPEGIDPENLRFSWKTDLRKLKGSQSRYHIQVRELLPVERVCWDSGWVHSEKSQNVVYEGDEIPCAAQFLVHVELSDTEGRMESGETTFVTRFAAEGLAGRWIGSQETAPGWLSESRTLPARYLKKEFYLTEKPIFSPGAFCGLGCYELYINGTRVTDHKLAPALSDYDKRVYYNQVAVQDYLRRGKNEIRVLLGNGRYFSPRLHTPFAMRTYGLPSFFCHLVVHYPDGSDCVLCSDDSWTVTAQGPLRENNEYDGEVYDARQEEALETASGIWKKAEYMPAPVGMLVPQEQEPIRITEELHPVSITELSGSRYIVDMGQNMVGFCRLKVKGAAGQRVLLRFAERLTDSGELYLDNIRSAKVTDEYILKGGGEEIWEPRFTYHGFRYVEISGYPGEFLAESLTGCVVHDDLERAGSFSCSSDILNRIYRNIFWGIRGNYRSIPTDCPQRDERQGWLGDRAFGSRGESYYYDIYHLYRKWLIDMVDCQNECGLFPSVAPSYWEMYPSEVTWSGTFLLVLQMLIDQYGDISLLEEFYEPAIRYLEYQYSRIGDDGLSHEDHYGDWCMPPERADLIHSEDPARITPPELLASAYLYHITQLFIGWAELRHDDEMTQLYRLRSSSLLEAFMTHLFHPKEHYFGNGTVTSQILPLAFQMVDDDIKPDVTAYLKELLSAVHDCHVASGLVGMQQFYRTMTDVGLLDCAFQSAVKTDYPSLGYMIEHGATTVWELWNGDTANPAMNSGNHVMLVGDIHVWLHECLAGIRPKAPGFREFYLAPQIPEGLTYVECSYETGYGMVRSSWNINDTAFTWDVEVPFNTKAFLTIPGIGDFAVFDSNGTCISTQGALELGSGRYSIRSRLG